MADKSVLVEWRTFRQLNYILEIVRDDKSYREWKYLTKYLNVYQPNTSKYDAELIELFNTIKNNFCNTKNSTTCDNSFVFNASKNKIFQHIANKLYKKVYEKSV